MNRLVEPLWDKALAYYGSLWEGDRENFLSLTTKLNNRFGCWDPPGTVCWRVQALKQLEESSLEELAERCQQLVMGGYSGGEDRFADSIAVDCLLKAAVNKDAALQVMNQ